MKKYIVFIALLAFFFLQCTEDKKCSIPVIQSLIFEPPITTVYGDSLTVTAAVEDAVTPLSTFYIELSYAGSIVYKEHLRTKGNTAQINHKFPLPFAEMATNGIQITAKFKSINIEGGEVEQIKIFNAQRPALADTLYLLYEEKDSVIVKLIQSTTNSFLYESETKNYYKNSFKYKIFSNADLSGIEWSAVGDRLVTGVVGGEFIAKTDYTVKPSQILFDTEKFMMTFTGDPMPTFKLNGTPLVLNGEYFDKAACFVANINLEQNKEVSFEGITEMGTAYNPDFFTYTDEKLKFVRETDTYEVVYVEEWNYLFVTKPKATFPEALWMTGQGLALPYFQKDMTSSWWDLATFPAYHYVPKIADNKYQITLWLHDGTGDSWHTAQFKFFGDRDWGGEIKAADFSTYPTIFTGNDNIMAGTGFTAGYYLLTVDVSGEKGTWTLEATLLTSLHQ